MARKPGSIFLPLDVEFMEDDKVIEAGEKAGWLYLAICLRSKRLMSDGKLTYRQMERLPVKGQGPRIEALLQTHLIEQVEDGYVVSAFAKRNPLASDITEKANKKAAGAALGNHNRWHVGRGVTDSECDHCTDSHSESVSESTETETETETETVASDRTPSVAAPAKHVIPDGWTPTDQDREWAAVSAPLVNIDRETENFVDYWTDKGEKRPGWSRTWKTWMRRAQERAEKLPPRLRAVSGEPEWKRLGRLGDWDV